MKKSTEQNSSPSGRSGGAEHPILFSTPMVQAILEGRKTQTRRIVKPQPDDSGLWNDDKYPRSVNSELTGWNGTVDETGESKQFKCPYGQPGDLLWVREKFAWTANVQVPYDTLSFFADNFHRDVKRPDVDYPEEEMCTGGWHDPDLSKELRWRPSIHMPKHAARLWLQIEDIRVERVQDISEEDIKAEGVRIPVSKKNTAVLILGEENKAISFLPEIDRTKNEKWNQQQLLFAHWAELWCDVNGRKSWHENPWVWVVSFKELSRTGKPETVQSLKFKV